MLKWFLLACSCAALRPPVSQVNQKVVVQKAASAALAAAIVASPTAALAARSGGRAGGSSFRAPRAPTRSAPTTIRRYAAPMAVPVPVPSPYYGYGFGGGMSPGTYLGLSLLDAIVDEQRRAAYMRQQIETQKQLGKDAGDIEALKAQLDAQEKRIAELQAQANKQ